MLRGEAVVVKGCVQDEVRGRCEESIRVSWCEGNFKAGVGVKVRDVLRLVSRNIVVCKVGNQVM